MSRARSNSSIESLSEHERGWRACLYLFDEMPSAEVREFEQMLEESQALRESFVQIVQLIGAVVASSSLLPGDNAYDLDPGSAEVCSQPASGSFPAGRFAGCRRFRRVLGFGAGLGAAAIAVLLWTSVAIVQFRSEESVVEQSVPAMIGIGDGADESDDDFELPVEMVAVFTEPADSTYSGTRNFAQRASSSTTLNVTSGTAQFAAIGGADIRVEGPALFGVSTGSGGVLFSGSVQTRLTNPRATYSVTSSNLKVVDLGTEFRVSLIGQDLLEIHVLDGEVEIQSSRRIPLYFWDFETPVDALTDVVVQQRATLEGGAQIVAGIVGESAAGFDNTPGTLVGIEGGAGEKVGLGRFSCSSGISVEAMIVSRWSGDWGDYDEVFRKNDGLYRVHLSLHNDRSTGGRASLSFCLHFAGLGFGKLTMPLDGREGRPALNEITDGAGHHVVATYDAFTGQNAIYVDGRLCFHRQVPAGTLILSGGPERAVIGNRARHHSLSDSTFNGVIDEIAYYDFCLSPEEIAEHYRQIRNGRNYFGGDVQSLRATPWSSLTRITKGQTRLFNRHTGRLAVAASMAQ